MRKLTFRKLRFSKFNKIVTGSVFGEPQLTQISLNFKTYCCNLKNRGLGAKLCVWLFCYFNFGRNYDVLKSQSPCILLNKKNTNFKGTVRSFHQKSRKKKIISWLQWPGIKLYISVTILWKKWIETITYWKSWWYPFFTPLKFNKITYLIWSFCIVSLFYLVNSFAAPTFIKK